MENHQSKGNSELTTYANGDNMTEISMEISNSSDDMENIACDFSLPSLSQNKDISGSTNLVVNDPVVSRNGTIENNSPLVNNNNLNNSTTDTAVGLKSPVNFYPEQKNPEVDKSLNEEEKKVDMENKLPIEKECFGYIQDIIVEKVNNIIQQVEEKEIRERSLDFDIYEPKSDSDDDYNFPDSFVTIDECESDYSIASEDEIKILYEKDYFKKQEKDNTKDFDDEDILVLDADEENEENHSDYENNREIKVVLGNSNELESLNVEISGKRKSSPDNEEENSPKKFKTEENNNADDDKLFEEPTNIKITISNDNNSPYSITDAPDDDRTYSNGASFANDFPKPFPNFEVTVKNKKFFPREEFEYVSQDPQENADNYNEEWQKLKLQIGNEAQIYRAIKGRWRNLSIPNPNINLTYRHVNNPGLLNPNGEKDDKKKDPGSKNHKRSRSCTSFYENIISKLYMKLNAEKQKLGDQHKAEVCLTQMMLKNELNAAVCAAQNPRNIHAQQNLRLTQFRHEQTLQQLKNACQTSVEQLENENREQVELYQQYIEEVRAFNSFYQGLTLNNDNLELTDEQYEHLAETERMYMVFRDFYE